MLFREMGLRCLLRIRFGVLILVVGMIFVRGLLIFLIYEVMVEMVEEIELVEEIL